MERRVGARPHAEAAERRGAADTSAEGDRAQLVRVGAQRCHPPVPWSRDDASGKCASERGIRHAASEQGSDPGNLAELPEFLEDVAHDDIIGRPGTPMPCPIASV
jgi:hypothetical protein